MKLKGSRKRGKFEPGRTIQKSKKQDAPSDLQKTADAIVAVADISRRTKGTADMALAQKSLPREQIERTGAEGIALAGEARFRAFADSLPELISFVNAEQRYQFCNKSYEKNLGISPDALNGRAVREVLGEAVYATFKPFIQKALGGQYASYEGYVSHEKFGRRYLQIDYIPQRDQGGKVEGFYTVIRNLTELKDAEAKFRAFVENSPQAIVIHDAQGKIVVVNAEAEQIFGYTRQEMIGQTSEILLPARFRGKHSEQMQAYRRKQMIRPMGSGLELYAQRKDGSEFPVEISLSPVETAEGVLVFSTIVDITARKRHEEQARRSTILEERARMARDVHDTLAQGFTGIVLNLEAAEEQAEGMPEQVRDRIGRARDVARQSLEEVRQSILALSSSLPVNGELTKSIREFVARYTPSKKTRVDFAAQGTPRRLDSAIEENLLRIAQQATDNALQHAHASSIRIEIAYGKSSVQLTISDDGQGFEVKTVGTGFGLSGMRERAKEIGAKFELKSRPGKGTRVAVKVPRLPMASK